MSRNQRFALLAAALVVVVAAIVIASGGGDDEEDATTAPPAADRARGESPTATTPAPEPARPDVQRITLRNFAPVGGAGDIAAAKGDTVTIAVAVDRDDEIHLHGYDITRKAAPGKPARFRFKADIEGVFELESHEAEEAGSDALVATLRVEP